MQDLGKSGARSNSSNIIRDDFGIGSNDSPSKIANITSPEMVRRSTMATMGRNKNKKLDLTIEEASPIKEEDEDEDSNPFEESPMLPHLA